MSELYSSSVAQQKFEKFSLPKSSNFAKELNSPKYNHLLAALPANDYLRLLPNMELIQMKVGDVLQEASMPIEWIYFPTTSVVCLGYITENGSFPAVGIVGNDGFVGVAYVMGSESSPTLATVQSSGVGYRIRASILKKELQRNGELLRIALLYAQTFVTQISQTAVCNRFHSVDQQLCRWLLMSRDRLASSEMHLTHELIANMLGVRREGVTQAAGKLQAKGLIQYSRGKIHILDREGMEKEVCECYAVVSKEYARLLPRKNAMPLASTQKVYAMRF
jgi:CRP-like cAMP-binding protein